MSELEGQSETRARRERKFPRMPTLGLSLKRCLASEGTSYRSLRADSTKVRPGHLKCPTENYSPQPQLITAVPDPLEHADVAHSSRHLRLAPRNT